MNRITWEVKQLINEFEKRSINYELLNNKKLYFDLSKEKVMEQDFDLILERSLSYLRGLFSCAILESKGHNILNNYECLNITGNKLLTTLKLVENKIPTPKTAIAFKSDSALEAIESLMGYPTVVKPIIGSWGRLIAKLDDYSNASYNLECRETMGNILQKIYYLQNFLENKDNTLPTDIRVFVIGDECVAAMGRYSPEKDFRSNIAIGGTAKPIEITEEIRELSLGAAKAVSGEIVGVDLMYDKEKLNVIEVNGTPQFRGVATSTKINIAGEIVDYIVDNYK